jgi:hypothetical protein
MIPSVISGLTVEPPAGVVPNKIFDAYWYFAAERQNIFWRRYERIPVSLNLDDDTVRWTNDPILQTFKFTNTYRCLDRVSQYLLKNVIYGGDPPAVSDCTKPRDTIFRIMFFKLFNRPETWELMCRELGAEPSLINWDVSKYDAILTAAQDRNERIFSNAYMQTAAGCNGERRHRMYLKLWDKMFIEKDLADKIIAAPSLEAVYNAIRPYRTMGNFLAMQYTIDINYSEIIDFSETDFIIAGPGAKRGINKCFDTIGDKSEADVIRWVQSTQDAQFAARGLEFKKIGDRPLQLIDCQSLFCEVDKYSRAAFPEPQVYTESGNATKVARIKQKFSENVKPIEYVFPPKWNIVLD